MHSRANAIREVIRSAELGEAKAALLRVISRYGRRRLWMYAKDNFIVDFDDQDFALANHRDFREQARREMADMSSEVNEASSPGELEAILRRLEPWIG